MNDMYIHLCTVVGARLHYKGHVLCAVVGELGAKESSGGYELLCVQYNYSWGKTAL